MNEVLLIMSLEELIMKNRSYRRFHENHAIDRPTLENLVNMARLSASAANKQPLRYMLFCDPKKNQNIFPALGWAAYLKDWPGPAEGERPSAYIVMLSDSQWTSPYTPIDAGIACQSILLGAAELGLGGCIIASIKKDKLKTVLKISERYEILLVIALGKPREIVEVEVMQNDQVEYWRDKEGIHHVPKRHLKEIILG